MKRRAHLALFIAGMVAMLSAGIGAAARAEDKPQKPAAKTSTGALTAEELELARYLDLLKDLDLFEDWDLAELLSVLEDEDHDR